MSFVQKFSKKLINSGQNASLYCSEFCGKELDYEYGISPNKKSPSPNTSVIHKRNLNG